MKGIWDRQQEQRPRALPSCYETAHHHGTQQLVSDRANLRSRLRFVDGEVYGLENPKRQDQGLSPRQGQAHLPPQNYNPAGGKASRSHFCRVISCTHNLQHCNGSMSQLPPMAAGLALKDPRLALHKGVRTAQQITTSS